MKHEIKLLFSSSFFSCLAICQASETRPNVDVPLLHTNVTLHNKNPSFLLCAEEWKINPQPLTPRTIQWKLFIADECSSHQKIHPIFQITSVHFRKSKITWKQFSTQIGFLRKLFFFKNSSIKLSDMTPT